MIMKKKTMLSVGKKVLAASLAMTMTASLMCGCGSEKVNDDKTVTTENENKETVSDNKNEDNKSEERVKLTIWSYWTNSDVYQDQGDSEYWKTIEEACNVDLEFVDSSSGTDALSLLVAADDMPDIIIDYDFNMPGGPQEMLLEESIIPLNDLMDNGSMPNFKAYLESDEEVDKLCKNNEGLYAWAPMIRRADSPLVYSGFMIRQDWLDELGLEMPETLADMEEVLTAFKEKKGADAPLSFIYNNYSALVNCFGIAEGVYIGSDNKVHFGAMEEDYLEFLTLFHHWMETGLMDPDGLSQDADAFFAKIASNEVGIAWGYTGGTLGKIETMKAENPDMNFQPMPYPVEVAGIDFPFDQSNHRVNNIGGVISATCENPEAAARVLDYTYGEEGNMLANYGKEGVTYEMVNGEPVFTDFVLNNPDGYSIEKALSLYAGCNNKPFLVEKAYMLGGYAYDVQKKSLEVWETPNAVAKNMPPQTMTAEEVEEYNDIMNTVQTYLDEHKLMFIIGSESLDNYSQFVEDIKSMNIERAIEIRQAEYDRYLAR